MKISAGYPAELDAAISEDRLADAEKAVELACSSELATVEESPEAAKLVDAANSPASEEVLKTGVAIAESLLIPVKLLYSTVEVVYAVVEALNLVKAWVYTYEMLVSTSVTVT